MTGPYVAAESPSISQAKLYRLIACLEIGSVKIAASRRIPFAEWRPMLSVCAREVPRVMERTR
jgi:hypothetical protein